MQELSTGTVFVTGHISVADLLCVTVECGLLGAEDYILPGGNIHPVLNTYYVQDVLGAEKQIFKKGK